MRHAPAVLILAAWLSLGVWWTAGFRAFTSDSYALYRAGPLPRPAPDFEFEDGHGRRHATADYRGRYVFLSFMYLRCPQVCQLTTARLHAVHAMLADAVPDRLVFISLSLDPARDTAGALADWTAAHGAPAGWIAGRLTGPLDPEADPRLARLGVWVRRNPAGEINHSAFTYLLDPEGVVTAVFRPEEPVEALVTAARSALR